MTSYASVLTITAFTVERYIAICKPLKTHKIVAFSRCIKIIVAIWLISLCCALPYPIHTELYFYVETADHQPIEDSLQCNIPPRYYERMSHVFQISTFVFFVLPLTVSVVLFTLIGMALRRADLNRNSSDRAHQSYQRQNSAAQPDKCPTSLSTRCVLRILGKWMAYLIFKNEVLLFSKFNPLNGMHYIFHLHYADSIARDQRVHVCTSYCWVSGQMSCLIYSYILTNQLTWILGFEEPSQVSKYWLNLANLSRHARGVVF